MTEVSASLGPGDAEGDADSVERSFLIGDVRGYTRFTREHGDVEAARLASRFAELARDAVDARGGRVIELRGDEALAVFDSAAQAVRAATELVRICDEEAASPDGLPLLVGVGIDAGRAVPVEGGFRGGALNTAARLCSQAAAGQVLVTTLFAESHGQVPGVGFIPFGEVELKGFANPVSVVQAIGDERPLPRPVHDPPPLPFELGTGTPMVGREHELAWLRGTWRQVAHGFGRVVVVSGPASIGKTRLAAEAAEFARCHGGAAAYVGAGGDGTARARAAVRDATSAERPYLIVLDDLDAIAGSVVPVLRESLAAIETRPVLLVCLIRDTHATAAVAGLVEQIDTRGDGHCPLEPLDSKGVAAIAALYAPHDLDTVPLETITRSSGGVPGRVHELMSDWAQQEASRRLAAAAEFLSGDRGRRSAELEFASTVIGLKLAGIYSAQPSPAMPDGNTCPFKGLAPFGGEDAWLFFGREQLVGNLAARTVGAGLLAVVGPSGSGKSSVIAAGLLPSLRAGLLPGSEGWHVTGIRPGEHPGWELDQVARPPGKRLVLAVDQFEEMFTLCLEEAERAAFVDALVALAADPDDAVVILGIRGDYYGHCAAYPRLAELVAANQVLVGPMGEAELRRAIELPARRAGVRVESALVDALAEQMRDEPGALPLLSTALVELWQGREDGWLRVAALERLGGVRSAVARLAEDSYDHFDKSERDEVRRLFLRLVTIVEEGAIARRRVRREELDLEREAVATVVRRLTDDRLLTAHESTIEVAHEALLREWPRFQEWLSEDAQGRELREHLMQAARRWNDFGRDPSELLRGARLGATLEWVAGRETELNETEREFLVASRVQADREADRQRRQNRRLRALLAGAAVLLAVAVAGGLAALHQRGAARHEAKVALGRQLGAEAVSEPRIDRAMLLARESLDLDRSPQTMGTLLATLLREPAVTGTFTLPITDRPQRVQVSPDGRTIAVITNRDVLRLFSTRTHRQRAPIAALNSAYAYLADGTILVSSPQRPGFVRIDPRTRRALGRLSFSTLFLRTPNTPATPLVVTPDLRYAFLLWAEQKEDGSAGTAYAERWTLPGGGASRLVPLGERDMLAATVTPTGRLVVVTDGAVTTWDPRTMERVVRVASPVPSVGFVAAAVSPDGRRVAYGLRNGALEFLDTATGRTTIATGTHADAVTALAFSLDSHTAVSGGADAAVIVWDARSGRPLERLAGHGGMVLGIAFSRDGNTLYSASLDGTVLRHDLGTEHRFGSPFTVGDRIPDPVGESPWAVNAAVSADGRLIAARSARGRAGIFATDSLHRRSSVAIPGRDVGAVAFAGNRLVVGGDKGVIDVWDVARAPHRLGRLQGLHGTVRSIAADPGGRVVAAVDGLEGAVPAAGGFPPRLGWLALWRDGRLVSGSTSKLPAWGDSVALSPDGTLAAVATNNVILLVDTRTGRTIRTIRPATGAYALAFAPDGVLATGAWTGIVTLWNPRTGRELGHPVLVAPAPVASIAFDPSGTIMATNGGSSGHTRLWLRSTLQQLGSDFPGGEGSWGSSVFVPGGRYLVTVFSDGSGYRWPATVSAWERHACEVAGRNLTREEWQRFVGGRSFVRVCPG